VHAWTFIVGHTNSAVGHVACMQGHDATHGRTRARLPSPFLKHHLHSAWTLSATTKNDWRNRMELNPPFAFVEDFWVVFQRLEPPSRWPHGCSLYLFRAGLEPAWEAWPDGGAWSVTLESGSLTAEALDATWTGVVLAAVGEQLAVTPEEICGCEFSVRRGGARCSVWTRSANDEDTQRAVGLSLRRVLPAEGISALSYTTHTAKRRCASQRPGRRRPAANSSNGGTTGTGDEPLPALYAIDV